MKMKVGELEMTAGEGIQFGPRPAADPAAKLAAREQEGLFAPALSTRGFLLVAGASVMGAAAVIGVALLSSSLLFLAPLPGLLLLMLGALYFSLRGESPAGVDEIDLSEVATERRVRVFQFLRAAHRPQTIEELVQELQWTEEALLSALQGLLLQDRIAEDLDLETGHWVYQIRAQPLALENQDLLTLPLEERLESTHSHLKKKD